MRKIYDIAITKYGRSTLFSRYQLSNFLGHIGIESEIAISIAKDVKEKVINEKKYFDNVSNLYKLSSDELCKIVKNIILEYEKRGLLNSKDMFPEKYIFWRNVRNATGPLLILLSGGTGVGTTYIGRNLSARLNSIMESGEDKYRRDKQGVFKWISTDDARAILRPFFSEKFLPVLQTSTYNANQVIERIEETFEEMVIRGYLNQVEVIQPAIEAVIRENIINNNGCLIMEGIHIVPRDNKILPSELNSEGMGEYTFWYLLHLADEKIHKERLHLRQQGFPPRSKKQYLKYFENIRQIKKFLYEKAKARNVQTFDASSDIIPKIMNNIFDKLKYSKRYDIRKGSISINRMGK